MTEHVLDTKGMNCPLPILHAKKKLNEVPVGEILYVEATDPGSVADFEAFCRKTGNELVEHVVEGDVYKFKIKHVS